MKHCCENREKPVRFYKTILLPEKVKYIMDKIQSAGFEAYAVGGCIRDSILGRTPNDWDITTSAKPEEIKALFRRTLDTGIQHGTVTVMLEKEGFEVTTYRIDGKYEDPLKNVKYVLPRHSSDGDASEASPSPCPIPEKLHL